MSSRISNRAKRTLRVKSKTSCRCSARCEPPAALVSPESHRSAFAPRSGIRARYRRLIYCEPISWRRLSECGYLARVPLLDKQSLQRLTTSIGPERQAGRGLCSSVNMYRSVHYTASKAGVRKKKLNPAVRYAIRSLSSGMKLSNTDGCDRYASLQRISSH